MIPQSRDSETFETSETPMPKRVLYPVSEAAEQLGGITERMVWGLIAKGELKSVKVGRRRMIPADAIHNYVEELKVAA